jgi:uncharacterized membrane protein YbaN (DUF454 family)
MLMNSRRLSTPPRRILQSIPRAAVLSLALLLAAFLGLGLWMVNSQGAAEPSYQGRPLRFWLAELGTREAWDGTNEAAVAVRSMGTNALPFLKQAILLQKDEPQWRSWLGHQRWFPFELRQYDEADMKARLGLACLREQAVSTLEQWLTNRETTVQAANVLTWMAPVGTPLLVRGLTNDDWNIRFDCAVTLSYVNDCVFRGHRYLEYSEPQRLAEIARLAVPTLISCLSDTNVEVAKTSALALGSLNAMPALISASTNMALEPLVRTSAWWAINRLQQENFR